MVVTDELRQVAAMARRDVSYEIGAFITLVNGPDFDRTLSERRDLLLGQIQGADLVAISRADEISPEMLERVFSLLRNHSDRLLKLSVRMGWGVEEIMKHIV